MPQQTEKNQYKINLILSEINAYIENKINSIDTKQKNIVMQNFFKYQYLDRKNSEAWINPKSNITPKESFFYKNRESIYWRIMFRLMDYIGTDAQGECTNKMIAEFMQIEDKENCMIDKYIEKLWELLK